MEEAMKMCGLPVGGGWGSGRGGRAPAGHSSGEAVSMRLSKRV